MLAEIAFVVAMLTWGRRRFGPAATWIALAFWLNPAVVLNGAVLGYLDRTKTRVASRETDRRTSVSILAMAGGRPGWFDNRRLEQ